MTSRTHLDGCIDHVPYSLMPFHWGATSAIVYIGGVIWTIDLAFTSSKDEWDDDFAILRIVRELVMVPLVPSVSPGKHQDDFANEEYEGWCNSFQESRSQSE